MKEVTENIHDIQEVAASAGTDVVMGNGDKPASSKSLHGWIDSIDTKRNTFVLRSRNSFFEVICDKPELGEIYYSLRAEWVVKAIVEETDRSSTDEAGPKLRCSELEVLNKCENLPFVPSNRKDVPANLRSRYRYLEFRDPEIQKIFWTRHKLMHHISTYLDGSGFISVETPILSTPSNSGANEFSVSSSRMTDLTYALPQSSQVYGELIVLGGIESYYQWSRCFRDEDLRSNRQPEFTQLHLEMSFTTQAELMAIIENALSAAFKAVEIPLTAPFPSLSYDDCIRWFGSDKPDLRFDVEPTQLPHLITESPFGEDLNLILTPLPDNVELTNQEVAGLKELARRLKFTLMGFLPKEKSGKFLKPQLTYNEAVLGLQLESEPKAGACPVWLGRWKFVDNLRRTIYSYLKANKEPGDKELKFLWVSDFPLFALSEGEGGELVSQNHPFTAPVDVDELLACRKHKDLLKIKSQAFDLVVNGEELGSGSMLIHQLAIQRHVLNLLGFSKKQVKESFGFILDALRYGAPPIGGFGLGFDRLVASVCNEDKIRNVMAFPKTKQGYCPVTHTADGAG